MEPTNNDFDSWYEEHKDLIEGDFLTRKGLARLVWGTCLVLQDNHSEERNDEQ